MIFRLITIRCLRIKGCWCVTRAPTDQYPMRRSAFLGWVTRLSPTPPVCFLCSVAWPWSPVLHPSPSTRHLKLRAFPSVRLRSTRIDHRSWGFRGWVLRLSRKKTRRSGLLVLQSGRSTSDKYWPFRWMRLSDGRWCDCLLAMLGSFVIKHSTVLDSFAAQRAAKRLVLTLPFFSPDCELFLQRKVFKPLWLHALYWLRLCPFLRLRRQRCFRLGLHRRRRWRSRLDNAGSNQCFSQCCHSVSIQDGMARLCHTQQERRSPFSATNSRLCLLC